MKIFYSTNFEGVWPVGTSAVIVAEDEKIARDLLEAEAKKRGLTGRQSDGSSATLHELNLENAHAIILNNGDC